MQKSLKLAPLQSIKLFNFVVNRAIGKDQEHNYLVAQVDVENNVVTISNHIAVLSGVLFSYRWEIEATQSLDNIMFEISANGFINILEKLDNKQSLSIVFKSDQMIDIASIVTTDQVSLFDSSELALQPNNPFGIKYSAKIITDTNLSQNNYFCYQHLEDKCLCGFRVNIKQLYYWLKLVQNLLKMPTTVKSLNLELRYVKHGNGGILQILSAKSDCFCWLSISVEIIQNSANGSSEQSAYMSTQHLASLIDLLSAIQDESTIDTIDMFFTTNHIVVKQENWQCLFQQCDSQWGYHSLSQLVQTIASLDYYQLSTRTILDVLPKLNIVKDDQKANLTFTFSKSDEITLSVDQDQVTSNAKVYLANLAHIAHQKASLNLLALQQVVTAFKTSPQIEWAFDITNGRLIIRDNKYKQYVVFALAIQN